MFEQMKRKIGFRTRMWGLRVCYFAIGVESMVVAKEFVFGNIFFLLLFCVMAWVFERLND